MNPADRNLTIEVAASGICGTDLHIYKGEYIGEFPVIPGHEFSGTVVATGSAVTHFKPGDRVAVEPNVACEDCQECRENRRHFCRNWWAVGVTAPGGMATHVTVPETAVFSIGEIDFVYGAFMEPLSCVIHGVEIAKPRLADRIAIAGAGPIGILLLRVFRATGVSWIDVIERNESRAQFVEGAGANSVFRDLSDVPRGQYDMFVDATGVPSVVEDSVDLVRPAGRILLFGVPPKDSRLTIDPFKVFNRELTILGSFTSLRNSRQAIDLIESGIVRVSDLVSHLLPLEQFARGIDLLLHPTEPTMKVMIDPRL